jgi:CRP-like cAMP-binding protein
VNRLGPGDFFGEISLIRHTPRTATVVATSPVRTLVITERSFQTLLEHQPGIQNKVMSALAARLAPDEKI